MRTKFRNISLKYSNWRRVTCHTEIEQMSWRIWSCSGRMRRWDWPRTTRTSSPTKWRKSRSWPATQAIKNSDRCSTSNKTTSLDTAKTVPASWVPKTTSPHPNHPTTRAKTHPNPYTKRNMTRSSARRRWRNNWVRLVRSNLQNWIRSRNYWSRRVVSMILYWSSIEIWRCIIRRRSRLWLEMGRKWWSMMIDFRIWVMRSGSKRRSRGSWCRRLMFWTSRWGSPGWEVPLPLLICRKLYRSTKGKTGGSKLSWILWGLRWRTMIRPKTIRKLLFFSSNRNKLRPETSSCSNNFQAKMINL